MRQFLVGAAQRIIKGSPLYYVWVVFLLVMISCWDNGLRPAASVGTHRDRHDKLRVMGILHRQFHLPGRGRSGRCAAHNSSLFV